MMQMSGPTVAATSTAPRLNGVTAAASNATTPGYAGIPTDPATVMALTAALQQQQQAQAQAQAAHIAHVAQVQASSTAGPSPFPFFAITRTPSGNPTAAATAQTSNPAGTSGGGGGTGIVPPVIAQPIVAHTQAPVQHQQQPSTPVVPTVPAIAQVQAPAPPPPTYAPPPTMATTTTTTFASSHNHGAPSAPRDYKYTSEISQMMFVFGEVKEPITETVNLVEDIVRSQLIELIVQARGVTTRRGARNLSAEDLIFLIRHDRAKVNRLRTYLSWKDVRKHAKDSGGDGGGGVEVDGLEDGADDKLNGSGKIQKINFKLPWEIPTIYSEVLRASGHEDDDEEDDDDIEAHEASTQRLKEADDATKFMTREEYQYYSECRQASFTYRKGKRFREFLNLPVHLDLRANDDTTDIVGFLAFEMVRSLTVAGLAVKKSLEESFLRDAYAMPEGSHKKRKAGNAGTGSGRPEKKGKGDGAGGGDGDEDESELPVNRLFLEPIEAVTPLRPEHIYDAFSRMQAEWSHKRSAGMRNWRGGLVRTKISLI